jgi:NAD(P)-dependent dehydrogenase (short-subunit alcohol dehydrogenase family)
LPDSNTVAVVTGASRGIGRGIAIALGSYGCTVYVTGRSQKVGDHNLPGTIYETAEAVTAAGGKGIAVRVDHGDDAQIKALIEQVEREQGRLDILVNNAAAIHDTLTDPGVFWEKPLELVDMINVGLRSGYVATYYAAPMLTKQRHGLVIFTGSQGGVTYMLGPAYGAHKAGEDKFAADMGFEFKDFGVAVLTIWCGGVLTDRVKALIAAEPVKYAGLAEMCETPEYTGHIVWSLYNDPKLMDLTGQSVIGVELAERYGLKDEGGREPPNMRKTQGMVPPKHGWPVPR